MSASRDSRASLSLQMSLYFGGAYAVGLFILTLLMFVYKAVMLPYPQNAIGLEVAFVFFYGLLDASRVRLGEGRGSARGGLMHVDRARARAAGPLTTSPHHAPLQRRAGTGSRRCRRRSPRSSSPCP